MRFIKNISFTFMGKVLTAFFYMLFDVLIARELNLVEYGKWAFFYSILTMGFCFCWLGINVSVKVQLANCTNKKHESYCILAGLVIRICASSAICGLIILVAPHVFVSWGLVVKYPLIDRMILLGGIIIFFNTFIEFTKEVFIGLKQYSTLFIYSSVEYFAYFLATLMFLTYVKNTFAPVGGMLLGGGILALFGVGIISKKSDFRLYYHDKKIKEFFMPICRYAIPMALISVGSVIMIEMDTFLLGLLSDNYEVAIYSIGKNLCTKLGHINYAITVGTIPIIAVNLSKENKEKLTKIIRSNNCITLVVSACLLFFSNIFITLLYGNEYLEAAGTIKALVPYYALTGISFVYAQLLDFRKQGYLRGVIYSATVILNVLLDILLIPQYGAGGAAIATDIALLPYLILVYILSKRELMKKGTE